MFVPTSDPTHGAAIGLDHVGIVGADLDALALAFTALGFALTPYAVHASGRTGNRCVMLRDGGYLELIATVPDQSSATLDRFLARGAGAHILALEVANETVALERLRRAGLAAELSITERGVTTSVHEPKARFAVILPAEAPAAGRVLLIRQLTRDLLWRRDNTVHPNRAAALTEAVYATDTPAEIMAFVSRLAGRPAEPDPLGGYRIALFRGIVRILPRRTAAGLFPGAAGGPPLFGLTIATDTHSDANPVVQAGGVAIRFVHTGK
jgi:Glyoxalase-like domain